ncbi:MAG: OB-fold domain-containing protein [Myxococcota bacterium]
MNDVLSAPYVLEYTYTRSTGPVIGRFLESLRYGVLEGVKTADGRVLCPPVEYDESGEATSGEFVPLRPAGTVKSWTWVEEPKPSHPLDRPFAFALIQIDGTDNAMLHVVDAGDRKHMKTGMRVRLQWAEERSGTIQDIGCFQPVLPYLPGPVHLEYQVNPGKHYSAYLRGLQEGKLIGGRDPESGKVYVPPRAADPVTGNPTDEYVEVSQVGVLTTFAIIRIPFEGQKLKPPYCFGAIVVDGADMPIYHLISGVPYDQIRMGMRVKAKWKPKEEWGPSLENILYFEPTGEPDAPFESYKEHL